MDDILWMTSSRMNDVRFLSKVTPCLFIITFFYGIVIFRGSSNSELKNVIQFLQVLNEENYHDSKNYEHTTTEIRTQKTGIFSDIVNNETTSTSDLQTTTPIPTIKLESAPRLEPSTTPERTAIFSNKTEPNLPQNVPSYVIKALDTINFVHDGRQILENNLLPASAKDQAKQCICSDFECSEQPLIASLFKNQSDFKPHSNYEMFKLALSNDKLRTSPANTEFIYNQISNTVLITAMNFYKLPKNHGGDHWIARIRKTNSKQKELLTTYSAFTHIFFCRTIIQTISKNYQISTPEKPKNLE